MLTLKRPVARRTMIGLDVGRCGVRAVQLRRHGDAWVVPHVAQYECGAAVDEDEVDAAETGRRIRECLNAAECHGRDVSVLLSPPDVEFHSLELPPGVLAKPSSQVGAVVRTEVQRLVSNPQAQFEADYWELPRTGAAAPNVLSAVSDSGVVQRILDACSHARVECRRIDTVATSESAVPSLA